MTPTRRRTRTAGTLADATERARIRTELDRTMVVEAAAGTGKTTELVERIVAVLAHGRARIDSVVAVTFTEKAAGELKLRLRTGLEESRRTADAAGRGALHDALARLEEARVGTIHAFCADLLRERSVEAAVDPGFETLTAPEAERVFGRAFDGWLQEQLADPPEGVRRSLRRTTRARFPLGGAGGARRSVGSPPSDDGPVARLRRAAWTLAEWRDFPAAWQRVRFEREARIEALVQQLDEFAQLSAQCARPDSDAFYSDTWRFRQCDADLRASEEVRERDHDGLEAMFVDLAREPVPRRGRGVSYGAGIKRTEVRERYDALRQALQRFARDADADLAALLQTELQEAVELYDELKARTGHLDFVDLLIQTRDLIREHDDVRREFQSRFTHLFVDEFQDTDPLQAEIILLLVANDPATTDWRVVQPVDGKLFLVADPKQSIYRFRRADVGVYLEVKELLVGRGAASVHLTTSFRSVPNIQKTVNAAFGAFMDGDRAAQQPEYVPLTASRADFDDQPSVVVLPVPRPYGKSGRPTKQAIEGSLPDAVGAFVEWLLRDSGWTVTDREQPGQRVALAARHICILLRRFDSYFVGDVTRGYVRALEARDVRHLLVGGRSFHEREEVETVRAALQAIEWPDDELSVFATLHGSLFAIGDEELLEYRQRYGRLHPFRIPHSAHESLRDHAGTHEASDGSRRDHSRTKRPGGDHSRNGSDADAHRGGEASDDDPARRARMAPILSALALLGKLHRGRNERPIAETLHRLLEATRAHAGFVMRPSGEQALANVLHIGEQARAYERSGGISFRGFVERLEEDAQNRRVAEAPILEEGSDGVRIMTVHRAKGLEFPVVILADITANMTPWQATRWIDAEHRLCAQRIGGWSPAELLQHQDEEHLRDAAEGVRIAYVAATRARDLLVVPAVGDGPFGGGWRAEPQVRNTPASAAVREVEKEPGPGARLDGWVAPLNAAIYPLRRDWSRPQPAPGCPPFGADSVIDRPAELAMQTEGVRPGRHVIPDRGTDAAARAGLGVVDRANTEGRHAGNVQSRAAQYDVVWWDPSLLRLDAPPSFGLRQEELLGKGEDPTADAELSEFQEWATTRAATLEHGARAAQHVQTATVYARAQVAAAIQAGTLPEAELERVVLEVDSDRPGGARFGTLVHGALATVPLDADEQRVQDAVRLQARILGATEEESRAASTLVARVLAHPLLGQARVADAQGRCRRETPLTFTASDDTLVEGVVDLAFEVDGQWTVVDFKTDKELDQQLSVYEQQVSIYAAAIAAATGQPAKAVLMRV